MSDTPIQPSETPLSVERVAQALIETVRSIGYIDLNFDAFDDTESDVAPVGHNLRDVARVLHAKLIRGSFGFTADEAEILERHVEYGEDPTWTTMQDGRMLPYH